MFTAIVTVALPLVVTSTPSLADASTTSLTLVSAAQTSVDLGGTTLVRFVGEVANHTTAATEAPKITIDLLDAAGATIGTVSTEPSMRVIFPGGTSPFKTQITTTSACTPGSDFLCGTTYPTYDHFRIEEPIAAPPQVHRSFQNLNAGSTFESGRLDLDVQNPEGETRVNITLVATYRGSDGKVVDTDTLSAPDLGPYERRLFSYAARTDVSPFGSSVQVQASEFQPVGSVPGEDFWTAASDGGVFSWNGAPFYGSMAATRLNSPIVGMASTRSGDGYWLVAADGGVFSFGGAPFLGSMGGSHLNSPIVGMASTRSGDGYWLVAADGGVFSFGGAPFLGSMGGSRLNSPIVGMESAPSDSGYWLVAADGGVFTFGEARFVGSMGGTRLNAPVVGMVSIPFGSGYWLVAADGGTFNFGDASFMGSLAEDTIRKSPIATVASLKSGFGFHLVTRDDAASSFGSALGGGKIVSAFPIVGAAPAADVWSQLTERFI